MRLFRASVRLCVCASLLACVDPRARPVPPRVLIQLPVGLAVRSPGSLPHTVYAFDPAGLSQIRVILLASDSLLKVDSTRVPADFTETTENYIWAVPPGMPTGTQIRIRAIATDFLGLLSADSTVVVVQ